MKNRFRRLLAADNTQLSAGQRANHMYVIGQPGTGKTRAIASWALQDIDAGHGVAVFDVHGDLYQHLLARLAERPRLWDRVVLVDPVNPKWTVGINPLQANDRASQERLALFLTDVVIKIWGLKQTDAPRLIDLLANSFLALANLGLALPDLQRLLVDADFRLGQVRRLTNNEVRRYFEHEYPREPAKAANWAQPLLNKLRGFLFDADLRLMLAATPALDMRRVLDQRLILLVNLPKGIIGERPSALFGAFLVAQFQKAALARVDSAHRPPFFLYLDEFQNYTTDNIQDIISESRKFNLSLVLAHQYLDQLPAVLRSAVLNATGTVVSFRIGGADSRVLAREIFPVPEAVFRPQRKLSLSRFGSWPLLHIDEERGTANRDQAARALATLPNREFWVKRRGQARPQQMRTLDVPDAVWSRESLAAAAELLDRSGSRYGRLKQDVRSELAAKSASGASSAYGPVPNERKQSTNGRRRPPLRERVPPAADPARQT